jgi:hypothetical protein
MWVWTEWLNRRTLTFIRGTKKIRVLSFSLGVRLREGPKNQWNQRRRIGVGAFRNLLSRLAGNGKRKHST